MATTSDTIGIPGGTATFWADEEMTARQTRNLELLGMPLLPVISRVVDAAADGEDANLTDGEIARLWAYDYEATLTYLKGWTLDRPLPASVDDLRALPADLLMALAAHAAKLAVARRAGFGIDTRAATRG